jgi:serine O-acetyltransferase
MTFIQKWIEIVTSIHLPPECEIGRGIYLGHFGPTIVHPRVKIGSNCNLSQGVTIGVVQRGKRRGVPTIGDRVYVGPNAVIIGSIIIGNDVAIGAGAVVTESLPDRAVVIGNPARIVSYKGAFDFVRYDSMEQDPSRIASLKEAEKGQETMQWEAADTT